MKENMICTDEGCVITTTKEYLGEVWFDYVDDSDTLVKLELELTSEQYTFLKQQLKMSEYTTLQELIVDWLFPT